MNIWTALAGGLLIGLAVAAHFLLCGRISGISGITSGALLNRGPEQRWRLSFIAGLLAAGIGYRLLHGPLPLHLETSGWLLWAAGVLVGFGSRLGNGCTSGHGVCGMSRLSRRSLIATATFILTGMLAVWVRRLAGSL